MTPTLSPQTLRELLAPLAHANAAFAAAHPGDREGRQPVHTVYGGAHLFHRDLAARMGALALGALDRHAPDAATLAQVVGLPARLAGIIYERVREKLAREPVEDFRVDFEDGYGNRPDAEEDGHAVAAATEMAVAARAGTLPPSSASASSPSPPSSPRAACARSTSSSPR